MTWPGLLHQARVAKYRHILITVPISPLSIRSSSKRLWLPRTELGGVARTVRLMALAWEANLVLCLCKIIPENPYLHLGGFFSPRAIHTCRRWWQTVSIHRNQEQFVQWSSTHSCYTYGQLGYLKSYFKQTSSQLDQPALISHQISWWFLLFNAASINRWSNYPKLGLTLFPSNSRCLSRTSPARSVKH